MIEKNRENQAASENPRQVKLRKSSKTVFTATPQPAKYIGTHPHLIGTSGVYYWNKEQDSYVYRPSGDAKSDWYRIFKTSLEP